MGHVHHRDPQLAFQCHRMRNDGNRMDGLSFFWHAAHAIVRQFYFLMLTSPRVWVSLAAPSLIASHVCSFGAWVAMSFTSLGFVIVGWIWQPCGHIMFMNNALAAMLVRGIHFAPIGVGHYATIPVCEMLNMYALIANPNRTRTAKTILCTAIILYPGFPADAAAIIQRRNKVFRNMSQMGLSAGAGVRKPQRDSSSAHEDNWNNNARPSSYYFVATSNNTAKSNRNMTFVAMSPNPAPMRPWRARSAELGPNTRSPRQEKPRVAKPCSRSPVSNLQKRMGQVSLDDIAGAPLPGNANTQGGSGGVR
jgi:hypothetical protein